MYDLKSFPADNHISDYKDRLQIGNPVFRFLWKRLPLKKYKIVISVYNFLKSVNAALHNLRLPFLSAQFTGSAFTCFPCTTNLVASFPVQVESVTILSLTVSSEASVLISEYPRIVFR